MGEHTNYKELAKGLAGTVVGLVVCALGIFYLLNGLFPIIGGAACRSLGIPTETKYEFIMGGAACAQAWLVVIPIATIMFFIVMTAISERR